MLLEPDRISHITFDCYGTLIDWETGILRAFRPLLRGERSNVSPEDLLRCYVRHESQFETGPWKPYRQILREILRAIVAEFDLRLPESDKDLLSASLPSWPPFPDTIPALGRLKKRFRLVVLSNIDEDLFEATAGQLEVRFDAVITAEHVKSYKPAEGHFREALRRLNTAPGEVIHVAQSLYHDHVPAQRLGLRTVWVERPSRLGRTGLAPEATVKPSFKVKSLAELAELLA